MVIVVGKTFSYMDAELEALLGKSRLYEFSLSVDNFESAFQSLHCMISHLHSYVLLAIHDVKFLADLLDKAPLFSAKNSKFRVEKVRDDLF